MTPPHIGRYEIKAELGRGGMAIVYHAFDPHFERDVALKVLPREFLFDQGFRQRFEREAKAIAALEHWAIVPVHDFGEQDGQPYLVMRFMPGGSLHDRFRQGPLALNETLAIVERIAAALDNAHQEGIIHRDVKPANILFDRAGHAYLSDFGIAKLTEATAQLTGSGIVGTPAYMAPEMTRRGGLTALIDVYALGIALFEMLTGELPYQADTPMGTALAHVTEPVPDILARRPDLPGGLRDVIERALAKDPADRYDSAGALAADLRAAPEAAQVQAGAGAPELPLAEEARPIAPIEQTAVEPRAIAPPGQKTSGLRTSRLWLGIGAVALAGLVVGGMALGGMFASRENAASQPTLSPTPQLVESSAVFQLAEAGVPRNRDWEPHIQEFDGVPMALVPVGCFVMGSDEARSNEGPAHEVCFEVPFWVDVYEVTNEQFETLGGRAAQGSVWPGADLPRQNVTWLEAEAFCDLRGNRLPTEAEWEYAARGPDGLVYPWGNELVAAYAVYDVTTGVRPELVGGRPGGASWVGALDMSGNIAEWVSDWYDSGYYGTLAAGGVINPQGPVDGEYRVQRGGSWYHGKDFLRASYRYYRRPMVESRNAGFRCARSYSPVEEASGSVVPTPAPPQEPALTGPQAHQLAVVGVERNADWTPYTEEINGVEMALVPVGCFANQAFSGLHTPLVHRVCFDEPFWIDVYEVTNSQFAAFGGVASRASNWTEPNRPRERITWTESVAFCDLRGARLPTEAEWEYAARGPDGVVYPWGNDFVAVNVVYRTNSDSRTWGVGSKSGGVSWVGAFDLSGNVWEWVNDWYDSGYYATLVDGAVNPQGPDSGERRVLRGGAWDLNNSVFLRASYRSRDKPNLTYTNRGFRCALSYSP